MRHFTLPLSFLLLLALSQNAFSQSIQLINSNEIPNGKLGFPDRAVPSPAHFSEVKFTGSQCISDAIRRETRLKIAENKERILQRNPQAFQRGGGGHPLFIWPIQAKEGFDDYGYYTVNFLVDHNSQSGQLEDYHCNQRTYDWATGNHEGTDLILWPYPWKRMQEEVMEIVAAAGGTVIEKNDGNYDLNCQNNGNPNWNGLVIEHSDGSQAWYWHFKDGAITDKEIGETVVTGEYLGAAGSSGSSNWPHLHFEIYDAQGNLVDPWQGECNDFNASSWWLEQQDYYEPNINHISTHYSTQLDDDCPNEENTYEQTEFEPGDQIVLRVFYKDLQNGSVTNFTVNAPDGSVWQSWEFESPWDNFATAQAYWELNPDDSWLEGEYQIAAVFDDDVFETSFNLGAPVGLEENSGNSVNIYPNPAKDMLVVKSESAFSRFEIIDITGRKIFGSAISSGQEMVNTQAYAEGVYFIRFWVEGRLGTVKKFVVHK